MAALTSQAMISSAASAYAERFFAKEALKDIFSTVIRSPEESVAGSRDDDWIVAASQSDLLVVLLNGEARPAVQREIEEALRHGAHIAGFKLLYPPYNESHRKTTSPEEKLMRDNHLFVRDILSFDQFADELRRAVGYFLSSTVQRFKATTSNENYRTANEWLNESTIQRYALVQNTSLLVLGSRLQRSEEMACLNRTVEIWKASRGRPASRPYFLHLFDADATEQEARRNGRRGYRTDHQRDELRKYNDRAARCRIGAVPRQTALGTVLLVNDKVAVGAPLGNADGFVTKIDGKHQADRVWELLAQNETGRPLTSVLDAVEAALLAGKS